MNPHSENSSLDYYERHAEDYIQATLSLNMTALYERFLPHIPAGGRVLDAGCGSGRDAKHFATLGFRVDAIDASPKMVAFAAEHLGVSASVMKLQEFRSREQYDGIWACASLVHLSEAEIRNTLCHFIEGLQFGGLLFVSLKEGDTAIVGPERSFPCIRKARLLSVLDELPNSSVIEFWQSDDVRTPGSVQWLNATVKKQ